MPGTHLLPAIVLALAWMAAGACHCPAQSTTISTSGQWNGVDGIGTFGEPSDATYGQTFTVPAGVRKLSSFAFFVDDNFNPGPVSFQGFVMAWDGTKATGPVLFQSGSFTTTNNHGADGFERFNVTISSGLSLVPGATYVVFFSASNLFNGISGDARLGVDSSGSYAGGGFFFLNNGSNFNAVSTNLWDPTFNFLDLAFDFVFLSAVAPIRRETPVILLVDEAAIASALFSSVPTALGQRELALGASRTTLRDFNGRLFRRRAGYMPGSGQHPQNLVYHAVTLGEGDGVEIERGARGRAVVYSTPQEETKVWEVFTSFDYGGLDLDATRNFLGVQSNTYAESVGVEHAISRHVLLGAGVSHLDSDASHGTDVSGETLAAYASYVRGGFYGDLLYGATLLDHSINRDTGLGGMAHANPNSVTHTVSFNTGFSFRPGSWNLGPFAGIDYAHSRIDGYTESGGGTAATRVSDQTVDSLITRAGAQASYRWERAWGAVIPQVRLGWERENLNSDSALNVALLHSPYYLAQGQSIQNTGAEFEAAVPGQRRERDYLTVGAGVLVECGGHLHILLDYEGDFLANGFVAHYGKVSLGWTF